MGQRLVGYSLQEMDVSKLTKYDIGPPTDKILSIGDLVIFDPDKNNPNPRLEGIWKIANLYCRHYNSNTYLLYKLKQGTQDYMLCMAHQVAPVFTI